MKMSPIPALVALLAATALPALAQDISADPSIGLSLESSTAISAETSPAVGPLDAQITGDNSYASLIAAINAGESVDLTGVTEEAQVNIVLVSTLEGDASAEGAALDKALSTQTESLRADVAANAAITAKLAAEDFTADDVLAVRTDANGSTIVYVDDRA